MKKAQLPTLDCIRHRDSRRAIIPAVVEAGCENINDQIADSCIFFFLLLIYISFPFFSLSLFRFQFRSSSRVHRTGLSSLLDFSHTAYRSLRSALNQSCCRIGGVTREKASSSPPSSTATATTATTTGTASDNRSNDLESRR